MAEEVGGIVYTVDLDTANVTKGADRVNSVLDQVGKSAQRVDGQFDKARASTDKLTRSQANLADGARELANTTRAAEQPLSEIVKTLLDGANSSNQLNQQLTLLAQAIQAVIAASALRSIAEMVQGYNEMADRVRMATSSTEEFEMVQARLVNTANGTFRALSEAQELYIRTADSLRSMGYSTSQAMDVSDALSYSFVTNATSAEKAANATDAFSKILAKGKVEADAWETIIAATPSVIQNIADASKKTAAEVRKLGAAGKLTAADLSEGLRKSLDSISAAAAKMDNNLRDAATRINTALTAVSVEVEKQTGAWEALTKGIITASEWLLNSAGDSAKISDALTIAGTAAASLASIVAGRLITSLLKYVKTQAANVTASFASIAAAQAAAQANLALAVTEYNVATAAVAAQRALIAAGGSMLGAAADANALAVMETRAALATQQLTNAQLALTSTATRTAYVLGGLRTVMGFLGGPAGVILLAATALFTFGRASSDTKTKVDALNGSLEKLTFNQLQRSANEIEDDIKGINTELSATLSKFNTLRPRPWETKDSESFKTRQAEIRAELDDVNQALETRRSRLAEIAAAQKKLTTKVEPAEVTPNLPPDANAADRIKALKDEEALLKKVGVARAKLKAIQELGDNASDPQKKEAEELAASIYRLQEAEKARNAAKTKGESAAAQATKKAAADEKKGIEDNAKAFADLGTELANVGKTAREVAQDAAQLSLNNYATPEQIQSIRDIAGALYDAREAKQALASADPIAAEQISYDDQLTKLQTLNDQKLLSDQRYLELRGQAERAHAEQMRVLQEENFKAASLGNELLLNGIDSLAQSGTQALSGLLSGTSNLRDALGGIANTVLNAVIGSFVQMGVDWVKQQIMMQAAATATTGTQVAGTAAVTAAQTAATGTIAATTTATAATTGTAVATAMAPAAALSSIASFGGAAVIGGAALLATMLLAKSFGGGRQYGGAVAGNKMYRVNEGGAPEIFNAAGGKQYMMPNTRGEVVSNKDATSSGGGSAPVVNVYEANPGTTVTTRFNEADRNWVIDVVNGDMQANGRTGQTVGRITGRPRVGS